MGNGLPARNTVRDLIAVDSILYAALSLNGIYALRLGGQSWQRLAAGTALSLALLYPWLYAARSTAPALRLRAGDTLWDTADAGIAAGTSIEMLLAADSAVFATGRFSGVFRHAGGAAWQAENNGLVYDSTINALAANVRHLYTATSTNFSVSVWRRPLSDFNPVSLRPVRKLSAGKIASQAFRAEGEILFWRFMPVAGKTDSRLFTVSGKNRPK